MSGARRPFGVAFAGGGLVAELHEQALREIPEAALVGLFEPDQRLAGERARSWGCVTYASVEAMLADPAVDAVYVLAPLEAHEELGVAALRSGRHVLIEKPVASPSGIVRLQRESAAQRRVCVPGHNYAYQPEFAQVRRLVRHGDLGRVRALWITYAIKHPESIAQRYGGVLDEVMIHHSYLALGLLGPPRDVVAGQAETAWESHPHEDQAWMTWTWPGGTTGHLFASFAVDDPTSDPWTFVVKVLGERGGATYTWRSAIFSRPLGSLSVGIPAYEESYVHESRAFIAAAHGDDSAVLSPLEHALQAEHALAAARRSAREGIVVRDVFSAGSPATTT